MKLTELKIGQKAKIVSINTRGLIKRRLMDMGLIAGTVIEIEKIAPLGDPIDIVIKNYHLSLRKTEAETIVVEEVK